MPNLYEIQENISLAINQGIIIDHETGEVIDFTPILLQQLIENKDNKIENIAVFIKNNLADMEAIVVEKKKLEQRLEQYQKKVDFLKKYLSDFLQKENIEKAEYPKAKIFFRSSEHIEVSENFDNPNFIRIKKEIDKQSLKTALKGGSEIPGAQLIKKQNIQIK